jgi:[acyl-carrier-protein] S-malonyltransferase
MTESSIFAYVFPGQGSQAVGMGRDLYSSFAAARTIIDQADAVLRFPLSRLFFEGPEEDLRQTVNAQPALVTVGIACLRAMEEVAGGSLPPPATVWASTRPWWQPESSILPRPSISPASAAD